MIKTLQVYLETLATFVVNGKHFAVDMDNNLYCTEGLLKYLAPLNIFEISQDRYVEKPEVQENDLLFNCIDDLGYEFLLVSGIKDKEILETVRNTHLALYVEITYFKLDGRPIIVVYDGDVPEFYDISESLKSYGIFEPYTNKGIYTLHSKHSTYRKAQEAYNRLKHQDQALLISLEILAIDNTYTTLFSDLPVGAYYITADSLNTLMQKMTSDTAIPNDGYEIGVRANRLTRPLSEEIVTAIQETIDDDDETINWPKVWRLL